MSDIIYNIFGSGDSIDIDIMVFIDKIPDNKEECKQMCFLFNQKIAEELKIDVEKVNANIAVIKDGIIVDCFKGTIDEVNNSIYRTYHLHKQFHPCQISRIVKRNVPLKVARALRIILSFLSRTEHRVRVKQALKGDAKLKIEVLKEIDLSKITSFGKEAQEDVECRKDIAFQIAQATALIYSREVYTKYEAWSYLPFSYEFLYRKTNFNMEKLELGKFHFLQSIENELDLNLVKED